MEDIQSEDIRSSKSELRALVEELNLEIDFYKAVAIRLKACFIVCNILKSTN